MLTQTLTHTRVQVCLCQLTHTASSGCCHRSVFCSRCCVFVRLYIGALCSAMINVIIVCLPVFVYVRVNLPVALVTGCYLLFAQLKRFSPALGWRSRLEKAISPIQSQTHWKWPCTSVIKEWWIAQSNKNSTCPYLTWAIFRFQKSFSQILNKDWIVPLHSQVCPDFFCLLYRHRK